MVKVHTRKRTIVANASPQMTLYLILRDYALKVVRETPALQEHAVVYIAACDVIDVLRKVKHRCLSTQEAKPRMVASISKFMHLHKVLYGTVNIRPKFAWLLAIAFGLADCEWLFDMWCIERQHRRVKVQAELVKNTTCFASSVLLRVLDAQVANLQGVDLHRCSLTRKRQVRVEGALMADACSFDGVQMAVDDIVTDRRHGNVMVIRGCILCDDHRLLLRVNMMTSVQRMGRTCWTPTRREEYRLAKDVYLPIAWRFVDADYIVIIDEWSPMKRKMNNTLRRHYRFVT